MYAYPESHLAVVDNVIRVSAIISIMAVMHLFAKFGGHYLN